MRAAGRSGSTIRATDARTPSTKATGKANAVRTCNARCRHWLRLAGVKTSLWPPFVHGLSGVIEGLPRRLSRSFSPRPSISALVMPMTRPLSPFARLAMGIVNFDLAGVERPRPSQLTDLTFPTESPFGIENRRARLSCRPWSAFFVATVCGLPVVWPRSSAGHGAGELARLAGRRLLLPGVARSGPARCSAAAPSDREPWSPGASRAWISWAAAAAGSRCVAVARSISRIDIPPFSSDEEPTALPSIRDAARRDAAVALQEAGRACSTPIFLKHVAAEVGVLGDSAELLSTNAASTTSVSPRRSSASKLTSSSSFSMTV